MTDMTVTDQDFDALIEAVRSAARTEITPRFRRLDASQIGEKSGPDDLVTIADQAAEVAITRSAKQILPNAVVVGEEAVAEDPALLDRVGDSDLCVIVDPIDGTSNFVAGIASFGVILSVVVKGVTEYGLLYDPIMDDWVAAKRGGGAWRARGGETGAAPLRPRKVGALQKAIGFVPLSLAAPKDRAAMVDAFEDVGQIRSLRCSCHEYATVATGAADFLVSTMLKPWDHAAGVLILQEAGGAVRVNGALAYAPTMREGAIVGTVDPALIEPLSAISLRLPPPTR